MRHNVDDLLRHSFSLGFNLLLPPFSEPSMLLDRGPAL